MLKRENIHFIVDESQRSFMLSNYLSFVCSPSYINQSGSVQWRGMAAMFVLYIVASFLLGSLIHELIIRFHLSHELEDMELLEIALGILIAPLIEEVLFRVWLRVNRRTLLIFSFAIYFVALLLASLVSFWIIVSLICFGTLTVVIALVEDKGKIESAAARHFTILFYLSIFAFGIVHIFNYTPLT